MHALSTLSTVVGRYGKPKNIRCDMRYSASHVVHHGFESAATRNTQSFGNVKRSVVSEPSLNSFANNRRCHTGTFLDQLTSTPADVRSQDSSTNEKLANHYTINIFLNADSQDSKNSLACSKSTFADLSVDELTKNITSNYKMIENLFKNTDLTANREYFEEKVKDFWKDIFENSTGEGKDGKTRKNQQEETFTETPLQEVEPTKIQNNRQKAKIQKNDQSRQLKTEQRSKNIPHQFYRTKGENEINDTHKTELKDMDECRRTNDSGRTYHSHRINGANRANGSNRRSAPHKTNEMHPIARRDEEFMNINFLKQKNAKNEIPDDVIYSSRSYDREETVNSAGGKSKPDDQQVKIDVFEEIPYFQKGFYDSRTIQSRKIRGGVQRGRLHYDNDRVTDKMQNLVRLASKTKPEGRFSRLISYCKSFLGSTEENSQRCHEDVEKIAKNYYSMPVQKMGPCYNPQKKFHLAQNQPLMSNNKQERRNRGRSSKFNKKKGKMSGNPSRSVEKSRHCLVGTEQEKKKLNRSPSPANIATTNVNLARNASRMGNFSKCSIPSRRSKSTGKKINSRKPCRNKINQVSTTANLDAPSRLVKVDKSKTILLKRKLSIQHVDNGNKAAPRGYSYALPKVNPRSGRCYSEIDLKRSEGQGDLSTVYKSKSEPKLCLRIANVQCGETEQIQYFVPNARKEDEEIPANDYLFLTIENNELKIKTKTAFQSEKNEDEETSNAKLVKVNDADLCSSITQCSKLEITKRSKQKAASQEGYEEDANEENNQQREENAPKHKRRVKKDPFRFKEKSSEESEESSNVQTPIERSTGENKTIKGKVEKIQGVKIDVGSKELLENIRETARVQNREGPTFIGKVSGSRSKIPMKIEKAKSVPRVIDAKRIVSNFNPTEDEKHVKADDQHLRKKTVRNPLSGNVKEDQQVQRRGRFENKQVEKKSSNVNDVATKEIKGATSRSTIRKATSNIDGGRSKAEAKCVSCNERKRTMNGSATSNTRTKQLLLQESSHEKKDRARTSSRREEISQEKKPGYVGDLFEVGKEKMKTKFEEKSRIQTANVKRVSEQRNPEKKQRCAGDHFESNEEEIKTKQLARAKNGVEFREIESRKKVRAFSQCEQRNHEKKPRCVDGDLFEFEREEIKLKQLNHAKSDRKIQNRVRASSQCERRDYEKKPGCDGDLFDLENEEIDGKQSSRTKIDLDFEGEKSRIKINYEDELKMRNKAKVSSQYESRDHGKKMMYVGDVFEHENEEINVSQLSHGKIDFKEEESRIKIKHEDESKIRNKAKISSKCQSRNNETKTRYVGDLFEPETEEINTKQLSRFKIDSDFEEEESRIKLKYEDGSKIRNQNKISSRYESRDHEKKARYVDDLFESETEEINTKQLSRGKIDSDFEEEESKMKLKYEDESKIRNKAKISSRYESRDHEKKARYVDDLFEPETEEINTKQLSRGKIDSDFEEEESGINLKFEDESKIRSKAKVSSQYESRDNEKKTRYVGDVFKPGTEEINTKQVIHTKCGLEFEEEKPQTKARRIDSNCWKIKLDEDQELEGRSSVTSKILKVNDEAKLEKRCSEINSRRDGKSVIDNDKPKHDEKRTKNNVEKNLEGTLKSLNLNKNRNDLIIFSDVSNRPRKELLNLKNLLNIDSVHENVTLNHNVSAIQQDSLCKDDDVSILEIPESFVDENLLCRNQSITNMEPGLSNETFKIKNDQNVLSTQQNLPNLSSFYTGKSISDVEGSVHVNQIKNYTTINQNERNIDKDFDQIEEFKVLEAINLEGVDLITNEITNWPHVESNASSKLRRASFPSTQLEETFKEEDVGGMKVRIKDESRQEKKGAHEMSMEIKEESNEIKEGVMEKSTAAAEENTEPIWESLLDDTKDQIQEKRKEYLPKIKNKSKVDEKIEIKMFEDKKLRHVKTPIEIIMSLNIPRSALRKSEERIIKIDPPKRQTNDCRLFKTKFRNNRVKSPTAMRNFALNVITTDVLNEESILKQKREKSRSQEDIHETLRKRQLKRIPDKVDRRDKKTLETRNSICRKVDSSLKTTGMTSISEVTRPFPPKRMMSYADMKKSGSNDRIGKVKSHDKSKGDFFQIPIRQVASTRRSDDLPRNRFQCFDSKRSLMCDSRKSENALKKKFSDWSDLRANSSTIEDNKSDVNMFAARKEDLLKKIEEHKIKNNASTNTFKILTVTRTFPGIQTVPFNESMIGRMDEGKPRVQTQMAKLPLRTSKQDVPVKYSNKSLKTIPRCRLRPSVSSKPNADSLGKMNLATAANHDQKSTESGLMGRRSAPVPTTHKRYDHTRKNKKGADRKRPVTPPKKRTEPRRVARKSEKLVKKPERPAEKRVEKIEDKSTMRMLAKRKSKSACPPIIYPSLKERCDEAAIAPAVPKKDIMNDLKCIMDESNCAIIRDYFIKGRYQNVEYHQYKPYTFNDLTRYLMSKRQEQPKSSAKPK